MFKKTQSKHVRASHESFSIHAEKNAEQIQTENDAVADSFDGDTLQEDIEHEEGLPQDEREELNAVELRETSETSFEMDTPEDELIQQEEDQEENHEEDVAQEILEDSKETVEPPESFIPETEQDLDEYVSSYKVPVMFDVSSSQPDEAPAFESMAGFAPASPIGFYEAGASPVEPAAYSVETPKKRNGGKIAATVCGIIAGLLLIAYIVGAAYFKGHMFPHTEVGDSDVSFMSTDEVQNHLEAKTANYELHVTGYGYELKLPGKEIRFVFDSEAVAQSMHAQQNIFTWPVEFFRDHDYTDQVVATYDEATVKKLVNDTVETHNASATDPKDAHVGYDANSDSVVVIPEEYGTKLDAVATNAAVKKAICSATRELGLTTKELVQPKLTKDDATLKKAAEQCNSLTSMKMAFTVDGKEAFKAGLPCIDQWIDIAADGSVKLNEEKINDWISQKAAEYTSTGNTRTYTRPDGKEITVEGGDYGWTVDEETFRALVLAGLVANSRETVEIPFTERGVEFNGAGKQDWGKRYIDVDMSEQHAYMYDENGELIWESDVITGNINIADRATPEGVWSINLMKRDVTLYTIEPGKEKPEETLVHYWMPFVANEIGLHDAWWQPGFGGTMYKDGYGSHGCVNLPSGASADLYSLAQVDDVVVTHW